MGTSAVVPEQAGSLTTEKQTYRAYVKLTTDAKGNTVVDEIKAQAETDKKDKDTGLSANWAKLEKEGYTKHAENEFIKYSAKTLAGAQILVPEEAQFMYIFQCGLNYVQNAKANAVMTTLKEGTPEPTPEFDGLTIDLRVGTDDEGHNSINETPSRRTLSDEDKLRKQLTAMGVPADKQEAVLAAMLAAMQPIE